MPLSNDQVVASLIAFYKRQGADLTYLLGDPIFQGLPLADRIEAVKKHATEILNHSSDSFAPDEKAKIRANLLFDTLSGATLAGAGIHAALSAMKPVASMSPRAAAITLGTGAFLGATGGLIGGLLGAEKSRAERQALRGELGRVSISPTDDNAIGTLALKGQYNRSSAFKNAIIDRIQKHFETKGNDYIRDRAAHDYPIHHENALG
jgi:hypothetical protein